MKIMLIQPSEAETVLSKSMNIEPLGLEAIGGHLHDHDVKLVDMRFDQDIDNEIKGFKPDVVGITGVSSEFYIMKNLFKKIKAISSKIFTIAGGPHATMVPHDFNFPEVDVVVRGEGEITFKRVIEAYCKNQSVAKIPGIGCHTEKGFILSKGKFTIEDLSTLPLPDRKLTSKYRHGYFRGTWNPLAATYSTRGCNFKCDFCCTWRLAGGRFKIRGIDKFIEDLDQINEQYIFLAEDNTIADPAYSRLACDAIKSNGIKKNYQFYCRSDDIVSNKKLMEDWKLNGLKLVLIGFEMTSDDDLARINKGNTTTNNEKAVEFLTSIGVEIISYFLVDPWFSDHDFDTLTEYVCKLKLTQPIFFITTPLPGTTLYQKRKQDLTTFDLSKYDFYHCVLKTQLPQKRFYEKFIQLYKDTYLGRTASDAEKSAFNKSIVFKLLKSLEREYSEEINQTKSSFLGST